MSDPRHVRFVCWIAPQTNGFSVGFHRSQAFILREDDEVIVVLPTFVHKIMTHFQSLLGVLSERKNQNRQISHYTEDHPRKRYQCLEDLPRGAENNAKQCPDEDAWKAE